MPTKIESPMTAQMTPQKLLQLQKVWQKDPKAFINDVLGGSLWAMQGSILESVRDNAFTVVKSGHGIGKTHITAAAVLWWLFSFYPSKVVTTAPTWTQVENVLWKEIGGLYSKAKLPLGGRLKKVGLDLETEDWFAIGLSTDEAERFQGFHSPNLLVVFDEAPGVQPIIWEAAQGLMTGDHNHFLGIGNPTSPSGPFFDAFKSPLYNKIQISCLDTPNYITGKEVIPGLTTRRWVEERKSEWGEHSPLFMSRVLGEFPIEGAHNLIPLSWCERSYDLKLDHVENHKYMGVDVARYGNNFTVVTIYQKPVFRQWRLLSKNTMEVANFIVSLFNDERPNSIMVDDTGVGGGVTDRLQELRLPCIGINFSESANRRSMYRGIRDEIYWTMREMIRTEQVKFDRGKHDKVINQLSAMQYTIMDRSGKIQVESKKELAKRGLVSPDDADSLALAIYGREKMYRLAGPTKAQVYRPEMAATEEFY